MSRWTEYVPSFDSVSKSLGIPLPEAIKTLAETIERGVANGSLYVNEAVSFLAEQTWHSLGRPSYRVALPLAEALTETDLEVASEFIRFPHFAFALELPRNLVIRNVEGHRLTGLLVSAFRRGDRTIHVDSPDGAGPWGFMVVQSYEGEEAPVNLVLNLEPGETVAGRLAKAEKHGLWVENPEPASTRPPGHDPTITSPEETRRFMSLALGAALFAVGANAHLVRKVAPSQRKRSSRKAANRPPEPDRWILGADISLPRRGGRAAEPAEAPGAPAELESRSLRWAHIRQGHLRLTPTGPLSDRSYVLRYIAPTIVRPDLPLAPRATRHGLDLPEDTTRR